MSIRIHELAKRHNMEGKDMLSLLKERGYVSADTRSVSSTISNIYVEEIEKELASKAAATQASGDASAAAKPAGQAAEEQSAASSSAGVAVAPSPAASAPITIAAPSPAPAPVSPSFSGGASSPAPVSIPSAGSHPVTASMSAPGVKPGAPDSASSRVVMPAGVFVKSAGDIAREKEAVAKASARPSPVFPAPVIRAMSPPPPRPGMAPGRVNVPVAPVQAPGQNRPAPVPPFGGRSIPEAGPSAPAPAPVSAPPAPVPAQGSGPAPVAARPASAPQPLPPTPRPTAPRPLTIPQAPVTAPVVTIQGDVRIIHLKPPVIVRDFAAALGLKPFKLISELNQIVGFASMNSTIDEVVAQKVAEKYGYILDIKHRGDVTQQQVQKDKDRDKAKKGVEEDTKNLLPRPPVVCILGHVDHGKTSLLDAIRKANVAAGEAGGITQHIGAYQIEHNGRKITFLDTPGHAAFTKMRSRGASGADVGVLVVAADDGFMPQTDEALKIALGVKQQQPDKFALLVAVNKMDVKGANLDQVKAQMQQKGIPPEDWGGDTVTVPVSAIKGTGINDLLEMILLQADVLELQANPKADVSGIIIESQIDVGRGPVATVIVQRGTLKAGDTLVCGANWAKVRAMFDDQGKPIKEAPPSTPVRVIGWSGTPDSGAVFRATKNSREAENLAEEESERIKKESNTAGGGPKEVSVEQLFANIAATQAKVLKVIVKTDVFGSAEAVRNILDGIKSTKVSLEIVSTDVGLVTKNDVIMAAAAGAVVLGFNTKLENGVTPLAKHHGVRIETFGIIYELGDKVRDMLADMLDPEEREAKLGAAEVRATFPLAKGFVAGCLVTEGKVGRGGMARLRRGKEIVFEGKVSTLKRFKDDANEVRAGLECGVKLDDFNGYAVGDVIECFEIQKVRATL